MPFLNHKGKDSTLKGLTTNVVYQISCSSCNDAYVGQTERHASVRLHEHIADLYHVRKKSVLLPHVLEEGHSFRNNLNNNSLKILHKELNFHKRSLTEMIFIRKHGTLNKQSDADKLRDEFKLYIDKLISC